MFIWLFSRSELTPNERKHYNKAFQSYKRALRVIGCRKECPGIWDAVTWELSTALFMYSSIMYENPPSDVVRSSILSVKLPTQKFVQ